MAQHRRIERGRNKAPTEGVAAKNEAGAAERERALAEVRAAQARLLDEALDEHYGATEVVGTAAQRPDLRDRAKADEEYVRTFKQQGGE